MSPERTNSNWIAPTAVRVGALWILVVALIKLFYGTPNSLPVPVLEFMPSIDPGMKLHLAIAVELVISVLALLHPRLGWPLTVASFVVYDVILTKLLSMNAESCGCFGSALKFPPVAMLSIDSACLIAALAVRPWKTLGPVRFKPALALPLLLACAVSPWIVINDSIAPPKRSTTPTSTKDPVGAQPTNPTVAKGPIDGAKPSDVTTTAPTPKVSTFQLPDPLPRFAVLSPLQQHWVGKHIRDTELSTWIDVDNFPQDGEWILFRYTCDHCKAHFQKLDNEFLQNPKTYVLIHVPDDKDETARVVDVIPPHFEPIGELPKGLDWVGTTPWTLELENGIVKRAYLAEGEEEDSAKPTKK